MPKYLINADFEGTKFIHKIYKDIDDWDEQIVDDLKSAISQQFDLNITSFNLYDEDISIEDIDDIISAFEELESNDSDDDDDIAQHDKIKSVNIYVKIDP
eukprot:201164_1